MDRADARTIADAYGLGRVTAEPAIAARGEQGRMWRVDTDRGPWAVKELLLAQEEPAAERDVAFQERVLAAGLPMARPIRRRDGHVLTVVPRPDGTTLQVRVYTWLELRAPDEPPPPDVAAALLGRLHALERPADGPIHWWFADPVGEAAWDDLERELRATRPPWLPLAEAILPDARAADAVVTAARLGDREPSELTHCHLDFNPDNVLTLSTGEPVIVDWENAGSGIDAGELVVAATDFVRAPDEVAAFARAYRRAGGTARVTGPEAFELPLAAQGHLVRFYMTRGIDPAASDEDRARSAWRVEELAANLLTLRRIDELVAVLSAV